MYSIVYRCTHQHDAVECGYKDQHDPATAQLYARPDVFHAAALLLASPKLRREVVSL